MAQRPPPETTQELKADIDAGKTGDKVPDGFDPGLATLGTDDEAAGQPATPAEVATAIAEETAGAPRPPPEQSAVVPRWAMPDWRTVPSLWAVIAAFVAVLVVLAATAWHGRV